METTVKRSSNSLFARPNLKVFILGAVLLVVVNDWFAGATIQASARTISARSQQRDMTDAELQEMLQHAVRYPSSDVYYQLSYHHQKRGNFNKARAFLLRALDLQDEVLN